jgi:hypothetical protein
MGMRQYADSKINLNVMALCENVGKQAVSVHVVHILCEYLV